MTASVSTTYGGSTTADPPVSGPASLRSALAAQLQGLPEALDAGAVSAALLAPAPGYVVDSCTVGSLYLRDDGTCALRYQLEVRHPTTGRRSTLLVLGRVFHRPRHAQAYLDRQVVPLLPAVVGRPELRALHRPVGVLPAAGLVVHAFPIDPELPTLAGATFASSVLPALRRLPGVGAGSRGLAACSVELTHYPRRERCVLRYRLRAGAAGPAELRHPVVYGKVHADERGARTRLLLHALHRGAAGLEVPRALGYDAALRLLLLSAVPGDAELVALVRAHLAGHPDVAHDVPDLVGQCGALVARLHQARVDPGGARPLLQELQSCDREIARLGQVGSPAATALSHALDELTARARAEPPLSACPAHGDLTPAQVLVGDGRVALVDLDGLTLAEPALDLGRFRAYLRLLTARSPDLPSAVRRLDDLTEVLLERYVGARGLSGAEEAALRRRLPAYTALALLGAATSACRQLKDRRLQTALSLVHEELG